MIIVIHLTWYRFTTDPTLSFAVSKSTWVLAAAGLMDSGPMKE